MIERLKQLLRGTPQPVPEPQMQILVICTGNICRSPTAEGVLRHKLAQAGLGHVIVVDSAGTQGYHTAEPPDARAVKAAARRGYDIASLKARPIRPEDFNTFDWLLAMDRTHLEWLQRRSAAAQVRSGLLMAAATRHPGVEEVPDPYYGGPEGFERVLDMVEDACDGVVARLRAGQTPV